MKKKYQLILLLALFLVLLGCDTQMTENINSQIEINDNSLLLVSDDKIIISDANGQKQYGVINDKINSRPYWLKDKEQILYISESNDYYKIMNYNISYDKAELIWGSKNKPLYFSLSADKKWIIYAEDKGCYLIDVQEKSTQRFADNCTNISWAPDDKKFIYSADNVLYSMEFNIKKELNDPKEIYQGEFSSPVFLNKKEILMLTENEKNKESESPNEGKEDKLIVNYDIYKLSLEDNELSRLTNLEFAELKQGSMELSADKKMILLKVESQEELLNVWLINLGTPQASKLIKENISWAIWGTDSKSIYFIEDKSLYQSDVNALKKTEISANLQTAIFNNNLVIY